MSTPSGHGVDKRPPHRLVKISVDFFSPSHIKLTYNNPNKDFKLDRKIFSSWKIKKSCEEAKKKLVILKKTLSEIWQK